MLVGRAPYKSKVSAFGDPTDIYNNLVEQIKAGPLPLTNIGSFTNNFI